MKKIIFSVLLFFPAIALAAYYDYDGGYGMMGWSNWGAGGIVGLGMAVFMVAFWVLFALGIAYLVMSLLHQDQGKKSDKALEILKQRYAKGEIDKKEFEEIKKDLI